MVQRSQPAGKSSMTPQRLYAESPEGQENDIV